MVADGRSLLIKMEFVDSQLFRLRLGQVGVRGTKDVVDTGLMFSAS